MPAPMLRFYPHRKAKKMRLEKYRDDETWNYHCTVILSAAESFACERFGGVEGSWLRLCVVGHSSPTPSIS